MLKRYSHEEMSRLWTQEARYEAWLEVELAAVKAWEKLGVIPKDEALKILKNASFDEKSIDELEKVTKHDMLAFLTNIAQGLGEESRFVHFGMTSSDCVDTGFALQIKKSLKIILKDTDLLLDALKTRAQEHKHTLCIGRSHGIHGEITTFGLSLALFYDEMKNAKTMLENALKEVSFGKFSGAMGNFAHSPLEFEEYACEFLDLLPAPISSQVISRDRHAKVILALALQASICEQIAVNIRHLQRTEVYEVQEYFAPGQKGSSAMPHKKNPILTENITGLCRVLRAYATPALENIALWHERDISHSSAERFIFPDAFITADFMLKRLAGVIKNLEVFPKNMLKNINLTGGLVYSGKVLLELPLKGISREDAYKIVQNNAMKVWQSLQEGGQGVDEDGKSLYLRYLLEDDELRKSLSEAEIKACFDNAYFTKNVDKIFARVFRNSVFAKFEFKNFLNSFDI